MCNLQPPHHPAAVLGRGLSRGQVLFLCEGLGAPLARPGPGFPGCGTLPLWITEKWANDLVICDRKPWIEYIYIYNIGYIYI